MASQHSSNTLSRESRRIGGLLLLSVVTVESGGYYLTKVAAGNVEATDFQESFSRAGHAHAGVLITLALVSLIFADAARVTGAFGYITRLAIPLAAVLMPMGFFLSSGGAGTTEPNGWIGVLWLGAACLTVGVVGLGVALVRSSIVAEPVGEVPDAPPPFRAR